MSTDDLSAIPTIPGRTCKGCTLCCSLPMIPELNKPLYQHCRYVAVGKGCTAYSVTEPLPCGAAGRFNCKWRTDQSLGRHWRPKICGMVVSHPRFQEMQILCGSKGAKLWRSEPYWSDILSMAKNAHHHAKGYLLIIRKDEALLAVNPFTSKTAAVRPVQQPLPPNAQHQSGGDWLSGLIPLGYEPIG